MGLVQTFPEGKQISFELGRHFLPLSQHLVQPIHAQLRAFFVGVCFNLIRRSLVRAWVEVPMNSRGYMLKRVATFHFSHRISDLSICTAQHEQFYVIDSQKMAMVFSSLI